MDKKLEEQIRQIVREELAAHEERSANVKIDGVEIAESVVNRQEVISPAESIKKSGATTFPDKPKQVYDLRPVIKEMLSVLVKHEILTSSLDRVLDELRKAALTSTRIQEIWANDDYQGYNKL